jgi:hypothetical protein
LVAFELVVKAPNRVHQEHAGKQQKYFLHMEGISKIVDDVRRQVTLVCVPVANSPNHSFPGGVCDLDKQPDKLHYFVALLGPEFLLASIVVLV